MRKGFRQNNRAGGYDAGQKNLNTKKHSRKKLLRKNKKVVDKQNEK